MGICVLNDMIRLNASYAAAAVLFVVFLSLALGLMLKG